MPMSYTYATYVFVNLLLFVVRHHDPEIEAGCPSWLCTQRSLSASRSVQRSCSRFVVRS